MDDYFEKIAEDAFNDELEKVANSLTKALKRGLGKKIRNQSRNQRRDIQKVVGYNGGSKKLTDAFNSRKALEKNIEARTQSQMKNTRPGSEIFTEKARKEGRDGIRSSRREMASIGSDELSKKRPGTILEKQRRKRLNRGDTKGSFLEGFK